MTRSLLVAICSCFRISSQYACIILFAGNASECKSKYLLAFVAGCGSLQTPVSPPHSLVEGCMCCSFAHFILINGDI